MNIADAKDLLLKRDPGFWALLKSLTDKSTQFEELFLLSALRKKARHYKVEQPENRHRTRVAIVGGCNLYPLHELLEHFCEMESQSCEIWLGAYDNYASEIMEEESELYKFRPELLIVLPNLKRCVYTGALTDSTDAQRMEAARLVNSLLVLARKAHDKTQAEIILTNFLLPGAHDLGAFRTRTLGADWTFRKLVNLELGLSAPSYVHICDIEFLGYRLGGPQAQDERAWYESKQPCSADLLVEVAREICRLIVALKRAPRKVLVTDLDNTIWGGVAAEDGLEGIELGDTSPRGEAYKAFQKYILLLKQRGVLLAVCSKNDLDKAVEPFEKHPEMVLRMKDFVSFKANWDPKSDNLRQIASELNLGLDSLVFMDDNPAEIEIVRQFTPEVATILLGPDPSQYVSTLADCRYFEPRSITQEDAGRTAQYHSEAQRKALEAAATDMPAYLDSLDMEATIREFAPADVPRLEQLINKSNQFNLTTRRRTAAEVGAVMNDKDFVGFSVRLKDRFADHGLISVLIGRQSGEVMLIDTWLMSCRVLKRQVEDEALNELARLAKLRGCARLEGVYLPTSKNGMVRDFYDRMNFTLRSEAESKREYDLSLDRFQPIPTRIKIRQRTYESV
ncbi:MAG: hypothetical protein C5B50_08905 [Verrucomicrobia bacterium]|nr:MAG: hypothetical protein C5B50_08905 [Verrucomicrobiota bacterium]